MEWAHLQEGRVQRHITDQRGDCDHSEEKSVAWLKQAGGEGYVVIM